MVLVIMVQVITVLVVMVLVAASPHNLSTRHQLGVLFIVIRRRGRRRP
jgi:hypothetical protein